MPNAEADLSLELFSLKGKIAVVTGSGRGLGRAIAEGMAKAGAAVVTCSRTLAEAEATATAIRDTGGRALALHVDVSRKPECERLVDRTVEAFGRLDIMLCSAGIDRPMPADEVDPRTLELILATNIGGYLYCAQAAARPMTEQGGGAIVMISSNASKVGFRRLLSYGISKAGVDQMVRTLAIEWADRGIRVNAFNPGYLEHPMTGTEAGEADASVVASIEAFTPMRRRGRVEEIVGPAIFLASDAASFITGVTMPVDGGWCAL
jgi:NAD(P)-dependent dehydrogenase (short-subunit alcohol dehydrogenase family)